MFKKAWTTVVLLALSLPNSVQAATAIYHLHKESSTTSGLLQLKTAAPDATTTALQSSELKSQPAGEYLIKAFDTQAGVPNASGIISAGSTVTFTLWMAKTANYGVMYPRAKLLLNNATGVALCSATGAIPLATTVAQYTLTCATTSSVSITGGDRLYLWAGISLTAGPGANRVKGGLDIEGASDGNYDSRIAVSLPVPTIANLTPTSGPAGTPVTINGSGFSALQGSNTVSFNGQIATASTWSDTRIVTTVPVGATTGMVVVKGGGGPSNGVLFSVDLPEGVIVTLAGNGLGTFGGDGGPAPSASLNGPSNVAADSLGNVYLADTNNHRIRKVAPDGTITTVAGTGVHGYSGDGGPAINAQLWYPSSVALDGQGNLFISDDYNNRIRKVSSDGTIITVAGSDGGYGGDGGPATNAKLNHPKGIALTSLGGLYIADYLNDLIRYVDPSGTIRTVAGSGIPAYNGDNRSALGASLASPAGVAVGSNGELYIADSGNNRIRKVTSGIITTVAGNGTAGFSGDGGPATGAQIYNPLSVATDGSGKIVIADASNRRIRYVDAQGFITTIAGNGTYGFSGDGGPAVNAQFENTSGVGLTPRRQILVADNYTHRIRKIGGPPAATIAGLFPSSGPVGAAVTISGSNFGAIQGTSTVTFNGMAATPTSWSNTQIVASVPPSAATGPVIVTVNNIASNEVPFTVPLYIDTISPASGVIGTIVTVAGSGFGATQGTSQVTFNGVAATPSSWSDAAITVAVPTGATSGPVVVTVNSVVSNGIAFTVLQPPMISSLLPSSGTSGTPVTIAGSNFGSSQGNSTVRFNGLPAAPTSWSNTAIGVPVPAGATTGPVVVTVAGLASNGSAFTIVPKITTLTPVSGTAGTTVTIAGSGFGATQGTSTVTFNGETAAASTWSDTSIVATVPPAATSGPVVVTVGGIASNGIHFSIPSSISPVINSLSPQTGLIETIVTITGSRFGSTKGGSTVTFNGTVATPSSWSDGSITVRVPVGATSGPVVVTVGGEASLGVAFTVLQISITYPIPGMTLNKPKTVVYGTLPDVSGDLTVVVNGRYAMINGNSFAVNNIGLSLGQNTITVTLTNQAGESATASITVQSDSQSAYVTLSAGLEMGIAPMNSTLEFQATLPSAITQTDLTLGSTDLGAVPFPCQVTMSTPGIYIAMVTAQTADSLSYQDQFALNALDHDALETLLRTMWNNMQTALLGGDITGALTYFISDSQEQYRSIFTQLQPSLSSIFGSIETFHLLSVTNDEAEAEAIRTEDGTPYSYPILYRRDENGIWKFEGF